MAGRTVIKQIWEQAFTLFAQVALVAADIPVSALGVVLSAMATALVSSPHLEFCLGWLQAICTAHGAVIHGSTSSIQTPLRNLQRIIAQIHDQLSSVCSSNVYSLQYLCQAGAVPIRINEA